MSEDPSSRDNIQDAAVEPALRHERLLFASVFENLPLGVGVYNRDGDLIHSNECLRNYGYLSRLPSH